MGAQGSNVHVASWCTRPLGSVGLLHTAIQPTSPSAAVNSSGSEAQGLPSILQPHEGGSQVQGTLNALHPIALPLSLGPPSPLPCWELSPSLTEEVCFARTMGEPDWAGSSSEEPPEAGIGAGEEAFFPETAPLKTFQRSELSQKASKTTTKAAQLPTQIQLAKPPGPQGLE